MMLTENIDTHGAALIASLLSSDEASRFAALRDALPEGWIVELRPEAGTAWTAFIYCNDDSRDNPIFTVCHLGDRVGWFAQWMNGAASSATTFTELWPILELILSRIFAFRQAHLATVPTEGWANTQH